MTTLEINCVIAEFMGAKWYVDTDELGDRTKYMAFPLNVSEHVDRHCICKDLSMPENTYWACMPSSIPHYSDDLDAMHAVEAFLCHAGNLSSSNAYPLIFNAYIRYLKLEVIHDTPNNALFSDEALLIIAASVHRAKALCRALGKWKEE